MIRHALLCPSLLVVSSCGLFNSIDNDVNNDVQGATATHLAVITVLQSPPIPGFPNNPTATFASVFFGNRPTETTVQPDPVPGATVAIADDAGLSTVATATAQAGFYAATSLDGGLRYDSSAEYDFTITDDAGVVYTAAGSAAPQEQVAQLQTQFVDDGGFPAPVFAIASVGSPFTLTRSAQEVNGQLDVAFTAVFGLTNGAPSANPTWTNAPEQPSDFLQLIVNDAQWRAATVTIPGSAFPSPGFYLVTLTAVREGSATSDDLFSGSAVLLGSSVAGVLDAN
jgi:hypothetical protein